MGSAMCLELEFFELIKRVWGKWFVRSVVWVEWVGWVFFL